MVLQHSLARQDNRLSISLRIFFFFPPLVYNKKSFPKIHFTYSSRCAFACRSKSFRSISFCRVRPLMMISSCFHRGSCEMFSASIACSAYRNVDNVSVLEVCPVVVEMNRRNDGEKKLIVNRDFRVPGKNQVLSTLLCARDEFMSGPLRTLTLHVPGTVRCRR